MADITAAHDLAAEHTTPAEMRAHRESFDTFLKFAIFAVLHVEPGSIPERDYVDMYKPARRAALQIGRAHV